MDNIPNIYSANADEKTPPPTPSRKGRGESSPPPETIRKFYGRCKGKALSLGKKDAIAQQGAVDITFTHGQMLDLSQLFGQPFERYELEIGFGSGEHLLNRARNNPTVGFIGVEPFLNGYAAAVRDCLDEHLPNIRFYNDDAHFLLRTLPDAQFSHVHLFYPDPWHKKRHWKRRFVSIDALNEFARILVLGGQFRCATDIDSYAAWTLQHIREHPAFTWPAHTAADFLTPYEGWVQTRYEAKARREGRRSCYLRFDKIT